jgi:hypothetical protein
VNWSSKQGELLKRAYWVCVLHERLLDFDLQIAFTGIEELEDQVPLPHFYEYVPSAERMGGPSPDSTQLASAGELNDYAYRFSALVALSRLLRRAEKLIYDCEPCADENESLWQAAIYQNHVGAAAGSIHATDYNEPPSYLIEELVRQLRSWRAALPNQLQ